MVVVVVVVGGSGGAWGLLVTDERQASLFTWRGVLNAEEE